MNKKVCPMCGCGLFITTEHSNRTIYVDGEGAFVEGVGERVVDKVDKLMQCVDCDHKIITEDTVTESFFHEVIAVHAKDSPPDISQLTQEQRYIMWESDFTFIEGKYKEMYIIKNKIDKRFGIMPFDEVYGLLRSERKVLVVHMDKTHVLNFPVHAGGLENVHK